MWRGNTRSTVTLEHIPPNSTHLVMKLIGQTIRFRWLLTRITLGNWALTHGVVDPIKWMLVKELILASALHVSNMAMTSVRVGNKAVVVQARLEVIEPLELEDCIVIVIYYCIALN